MKRLLMLIFSVFLLDSAFAQDSATWVTPIEEVVIVDKLSAADLYNNLKKATSAEDRYLVIKPLSSDKELGNISAEYKIRGSRMVVKFKMDVAVKDGKYKYSIDEVADVLLEGVIEQGLVGIARRLRDNDYHNTGKKAESKNKEDKDRDVEKIAAAKAELKDFLDAFKARMSKAPLTDF